MVLTRFREGTNARLAMIEADVRTDFNGQVELAPDLDVFPVQLAWTDRTALPVPPFRASARRSLTLP